MGSGMKATKLPEISQRKVLEIKMEQHSKTVAKHNPATLKVSALSPDQSRLTKPIPLKKSGTQTEKKEGGLNLDSNFNPNARLIAHNRKYSTILIKVAGRRNIEIGQDSPFLASSKSGINSKKHIRSNINGELGF